MDETRLFCDGPGCSVEFYSGDIMAYDSSEGLLFCSARCASMYTAQLAMRTRSVQVLSPDNISFEEARELYESGALKQKSR